jgi:O-antigen ligase
VEPERLVRGTAVALAALLFFAVLTIWVPERWALSALQTGVFLLAAVWSCRLLLRPLPLCFGFPTAALLAAVFWGLLQLALGTTVSPHDTWEALLYWAAALILFFLSSQVLAAAEIRTRFLRALLYFGFGISIISVVQLYTSAGRVFWLFPSGYTDKVMGPFVYHNNYAAFIELLLPLAFIECLRDRRRTALYALIAGAMYASVIASTSRSGAILITVEILILTVLVFFRGVLRPRWAAMALVLLPVFAAAFTAIFGWRLLWERLQQPDPYVHRREILLSALDMARERPGIGFGLGTFPTAYPAYATFDLGLFVNHAHNDWAEWLAEGGVPFLLLTLSVAVWAVRPAFRSLWGVGILIVFAHALVDYPMQRLGLAAWVFVMLGALDAREREARTPERREPLSL